MAKTSISMTILLSILLSTAVDGRRYAMVERVLADEVIDPQKQDVYDAPASLDEGEADEFGEAAEETSLAEQSGKSDGVSTEEADETEERPLLRRVLARVPKRLPKLQPRPAQVPRLPQMPPRNLMAGNSMLRPGVPGMKPFQGVRLMHMSLRHLYNPASRTLHEKKVLRAQNYDLGATNDQVKLFCERFKLATPNDFNSAKSLSWKHPLGDKVKTAVYLQTTAAGNTTGTQRGFLVQENDNFIFPWQIQRGRMFANRLLQMSEHYNVEFRRVDSVTSATKFIKGQDYEGGKIQHLVFAAHGNEEGLLLGPNVGGFSGQNWLTADEKRRTQKAFLDAVRPCLKTEGDAKSSVVVGSCDGGTEIDGQLNLAQQLAKAWKGAKVHAWDRKTTGVHLDNKKFQSNPGKWSGTTEDTIPKKTPLGYYYPRVRALTFQYKGAGDWYSGAPKKMRSVSLVELSEPLATESEKPIMQINMTFQSTCWSMCKAFGDNCAGIGFIVDNLPFVLLDSDIDSTNFLGNCELFSASHDEAASSRPDAKPKWQGLSWTLQKSLMALGYDENSWDWATTNHPEWLSAAMASLYKQTETPEEDVLDDVVEANVIGVEAEDGTLEQSPLDEELVEKLRQTIPDVFHD